MCSTTKQKKLESQKKIHIHDDIPPHSLKESNVNLKMKIAEEIIGVTLLSS